MDPIPIFVLKECLSYSRPLILNIVNTSLITESFPQPFNVAAIPMTNQTIGPYLIFPFLAKFLERLVFTTLLSLVMEHAFRTFLICLQYGHCTETALVRVMNHLLISADSGAFTILVLLDLSGAFDVMSHSILIDRMETRPGFQ